MSAETDVVNALLHQLPTGGVAHLYDINRDWETQGYQAVWGGLEAFLSKHREFVVLGEGLVCKADGVASPLVSPGNRGRELFSPSGKEKERRSNELRVMREELTQNTMMINKIKVVPALTSPPHWPVQRDVTAVPPQPVTTPQHAGQHSRCISPTLPDDKKIGGTLQSPPPLPPAVDFCPADSPSRPVSQVELQQEINDAVTGLQLRKNHFMELASKARSASAIEVSPRPMSPLPLAQQQQQPSNPPSLPPSLPPSFPAPTSSPSLAPHSAIPTPTHVPAIQSFAAPAQPSQAETVSDAVGGFLDAMCQKQPVFVVEAAVEEWLKNQARAPLSFPYTPHQEYKGIVSYILSKRDRANNPLVGKDIAADASSIAEGSVEDLVVCAPRVFSTSDVPSSSVTFELASQVCPSHYTLAYGVPAHVRSHPQYFPAAKLRSWKLEGSADGVQYHVLSVHHNDDAFGPADRPHDVVVSFKIPDPAERYFKFFKITQLGPNAAGNHSLSLSGFELYGKLLLR